jgi:hypothetical protein
VSADCFLTHSGYDSPGTLTVGLHLNFSGDVAELSARNHPWRLRETLTGEGAETRAGFNSWFVRVKRGSHRAGAQLWSPGDSEENGCASAHGRARLGLSKRVHRSPSLRSAPSLLSLPASRRIFRERPKASRPRPAPTGCGARVAVVHLHSIPCLEGAAADRGCPSEMRWFFVRVFLT